RTEETFSPSKLRPYKIILSLGASMDSGKTTSAAYTCRGLRAAGKRVAFIKLTGTVYTKDIHFARDCGAQISTDFSKFGFPSTYMCELQELLNLFEGLLTSVETVKPDYVVIEIADGIFQRETEMLLRNQAFMSTVSHVVFSAPESLSALNGIRLLKEHGIEPFAVSGLFTTSPLLRQEVASRTHIPVKHIAEIGTPAILEMLGGHAVHDQMNGHQPKSSATKRMTVASAA
ncbi:MAG: hypothetical protein IT258_03260, partial [Saprospiraceae bacterium]|nr:hypothetical protein [Saprospiraceae bacterium]